MENNEKKVPETEKASANTNSFGAWWNKLAAAAKAGIIAGAALIVIIPLVLVIALGGNKPADNDTGNDNNDGGNNADTKVTYTVTVVDAEGNPIKGAKVEFTVGNIPMAVETDAEGKATQKSAKTVTAKVTEIPKNYTYDKLNQKLTFDADGKVTVAIEKRPDLVIKVVDQDGNPIAGVAVQMCDTLCKMPVTTGEDGLARYSGEEGNWKAQLSALPAGYTVDDVSAYYNFEDNLAIITLTKIAD